MEQNLLAQFAAIYKDHKTNSSLAVTAAAAGGGGTLSVTSRKREQPEAAEDEDMVGDINIDDIEDGVLDDLHLFGCMGNVAGGSGTEEKDSPEQQEQRRAAQRAHLKSQQKERGQPGT